MSDALNLVTPFGKKEYHLMEYINGTTLDGVYDMSKYISHYGLPYKMDSQKVIDVGCSTGYFSVEMAKKGANVTSVDLWPQHEILYRISMDKGFSINYVCSDIVKLEEALSPQKFDLVFCSNLIMHLNDPYTAIKNLSSVCEKQLIMSTAIYVNKKEYEKLDEYAEANELSWFLGKDEYGIDYGWIMSASCVLKMLKLAGFKYMKLHDRYRCDPIPYEDNEIVGVPIGVFHAWK